MYLLLFILVLSLFVAGLFKLGEWENNKRKIAVQKHVEAQRPFIDALKRKDGLNPIKSPIKLDPGESCFYCGGGRLVKLRRTRTGLSYQGITTRVKLGRNTYYRLGHYSGGATTREEWKDVDHGMVTVTDRRIVFLGQKQNETARFKDVLGVSCAPDGHLRVDKGHGQPFVLTQCQSLIIRALYVRMTKSSRRPPLPDGNGQNVKKITGARKTAALSANPTPSIEKGSQQKASTPRNGKYPAQSCRNCGFAEWVWSERTYPEGRPRIIVQQPGRCTAKTPNAASPGRQLDARQPFSDCPSWRTDAY